MIYNKEISKNCKDFTVDTEKLCYTDARSGALREKKNMILEDINNFKTEKTCIYKDESYSVRDNGAVLRHSKENTRKRKIDEIWTFGNVDDKGFLRIGGEKIRLCTEKRLLFILICDIL